MEDRFSKLLRSLKDKLHGIPGFYEDAEIFVMSCAEDIETTEEIIRFIELEEPTTSELILFCNDLGLESTEYIDDSEYADDDMDTDNDGESEDD